MTTLKNTLFNYYSGNIHFSKPLGRLTLEQFVRANKQPSGKVIKKLIAIQKCGDKAERRKLKQDLFCFTPGVLLKDGTPRKYENIVNFTGLMQLDFDGFSSKELAFDYKYKLMDSFDEIVVAYVSPSGLGVKALMRIPVVSNVEEYKSYWRAVADAFKNVKEFDSATKNAILPLFISFDSSLIVNWGASVWTKTKAEEQTPFTARPQFTAPIELDAKSKDFYKNKTINIFNNKIDSIVDNGHPQVVNACLVLGSRSGAGYIDEFECMSLIVSAIERNNYLSKDSKGYIRTGLKMFKDATSRPLNY